MRLYKILGVIHLILSAMLVGCAGVEPTADPVQPGSEDNLENENENELDNENNENLNNNLNNENDLNDEENPNNEQGLDNENNDELVNGAENENFEQGNNENNQGNLFANDESNGTGPDENGSETSEKKADVPENDGSNNILVDGGQGTGNNGNQTMTNINQGVTDTSMANGSPKPLPSGGVVRYVQSNGSNGYDSPNGKVVKNLEQGDHPLVTDEGEWSRTSDGLYISSGSLTARPVPRAKARKGWR